MAGDLIYEDANGDGKLDSNDRIYTKHTDIPAITYGFNLGATWKNIDLSMIWQGVGAVSHIYNREVLGEFSGDASHPSTLWKTHGQTIITMLNSLVSSRQETAQAT